jgi:hypothetical protein
MKSFLVFICFEFFFLGSIMSDLGEWTEARELGFGHMVSFLFLTVGSFYLGFLSKEEL